MSAKRIIEIAVFGIPFVVACIALFQIYGSTHAYAFRAERRVLHERCEATVWDIGERHAKIDTRVWVMLTCPDGVTYHGAVKFQSQR